MIITFSNAIWLFFSENEQTIFEVILFFLYKF